MFEAKEKDELLRRLYQHRGYQSITEAKDREIVRALRSDQLVVFVDSFEFAAKITESGIVFYEGGGYRKKDDRQEAKDAIVRNKISKKEVIGWVISIVGLILTIVFGLLTLFSQQLKQFV